MNRSVVLPPQLDNQMAIALLSALVLHAVVLLLLDFRIDFNPVNEVVDTLDVVLVNFRSESPPEQAEFLAPVSQQGGGEVEDAERPAAPLSPDIPSLAAGDMPVNSVEAQPVPAPDRRERIDVQRSQASFSTQITQVEEQEPTTISADQLRQQSMQMARLQPESDRQEAWRSKLPRRRYISANTREYEYASYMAAWVSKVERVGNLNYPLELKRRGVAGDLLMTVGIRVDGSVESISIQRESGIPELDEAAVRIVRLAAPYAPLSSEIAANVDVLHITRTWRFSNGNRFE